MHVATDFMANACMYVNTLRGTRIPSEMCAGKHIAITDGTHASLVIYVHAVLGLLLLKSNVLLITRCFNFYM